MRIEKKKLAQLIPTDYNPRKISNTELEKLKRSIMTYGYNDPIIINTKNNHIIAGNQRFKILNELNQLTEYNYDEIDVILLELDENNEKAFNIAHNKISGEFDEDKVNEILLELSLDDFDITLTGFDLNMDVEDINSAIGLSENTKTIDTLIQTRQVVIDCKNEQEQKELYTRLKEEGYKCQTLTL